MANYTINNRNKVKRVPERGHYDHETVYDILDKATFCHMGFAADNQPFVIPTLFGRRDNVIFVHGASSSRMIKHMEAGFPVCVTVTHVDGYVLARSAFHHSMNYRSAVLFGTARLVAEDEKMEALEIISNHIIPGRWEEVRLPNAKELKATSVLAIEIEQASAKIRTGGANDDKQDLDLDVWAGVVPIVQNIGHPVANHDLQEKTQLSNSIQKLIHTV